MPPAGAQPPVQLSLFEAVKVPAVPQAPSAVAAHEPPAAIAAPALALALALEPTRHRPVQATPLPPAMADAVDAPSGVGATELANPAFAGEDPGFHGPLRHPQAQHHIRLGEQTVAYQLRRASRRTIGFSVGPEGLSVSAPRWVGRGEIDAALHEKGPWILRKLQEQGERSRRLHSARMQWREGASLPFLGEPVILVLDPRVSGAVLKQAEQAPPGLPGLPRLTLHLGLPQEASQSQIRDVVQSWLQRQARRVFEERAAIFAQRLGVQFKRLALSSASTRWGSASADGSIRLNWRLIHFAMPVVDYVVTHELAHLREMNHSPAFWAVVRSAMPSYEQARGALQTQLLPSFE